MNKLEVVVGIIIENNQVFAFRRSIGKYASYFEFPGGKVEQGESYKQALIREFDEELNVCIKVKDLIDVVDYSYPDFDLRMHCYYVDVFSGDIELSVHDKLVKVSKDNIDELKWLDATRLIIDKIKCVL